MEKISLHTGAMRQAIQRAVIEGHDVLQCYNPLLLIAGKCLISFERVITTGGSTVCKPLRGTSESWHCVILDFCSGSNA